MRAPTARPPIRLAYQRPVAVPPPCDHWTEDVGRNEERIPYPNWGCATQRNLAVMVDNARDLQPAAGGRPALGRAAQRDLVGLCGQRQLIGRRQRRRCGKKAPASAVKK